MLNMDEVNSQNDRYTDQSDHDEDEATAPVLNEWEKTKSGKTFKRVFIFLQKRLDSVPQKNRLDSLKKEGRIQEVAFFLTWTISAKF